MSRLPITIATWDYDRVRAFTDGRVPVEGCDVNYITMPVEECFERAFFHGEFEVAEIGFSPFLIALSRGPTPYVAVPVFLSRMFRHSAVYIRTDRGIDGPGRSARQDHRRAGISDVGGDVVPRLPEGRIRHRDQGHQLGAGGARKSRPPRQVSAQSAGGLSAHLAQRRIAVADAGRRRARRRDVGAHALVLRQRHPQVRRLFPDYRAAERDYYKKTGIFPIMHALGIRRDIYDKNRWLAASLFKAYLKAKRLADAEFVETTALKIGLPWVTAEYE